MSVTVQGLTKKFGQQIAVNDVSFTAKKGEILGFLGPNGAGKSTTMKMITGYLPANDGHISVDGLDPEKDPLKLKARIGYLPEHNPLYLDMYVREYLEFFGRLHKVPSLPSRIDEMIDQTGLTLEQNKRIRALSKGYRQRVGLAQAMLHDPEVLILDEPTSGLDPNQLIEIRQLIRRMATEKTVIFSTHIMQEVQHICDRVVIINRGKIVANDTIDTLRARLKGQVMVRVEFQRYMKEQLILTLPGVKQVQSIGGNAFKVLTNSDLDIRPDLFRLAVDNENIILELSREENSVEDVFRSLTYQQT